MMQREDEALVMQTNGCEDKAVAKQRSSVEDKPLVMQ